MNRAHLVGVDAGPSGSMSPIHRTLPRCPALVPDLTMLINNAGIHETTDISAPDAAAVHAGFINTDMVADFTGPTLSPVDAGNITLDAVARGEQEVLIDHMARGAKAHSIGAAPPFHRGGCPSLKY